MISKNVQAVILAAGRSARFNTDQSKLLARICGKEMILYTTSLLEKMHIPVTLVVGFQKERLSHVVKTFHGNFDVNFIDQSEQLGTGHALRCSRPSWHADHILVMNGDAPLLTNELLVELIERHLQSNAAMSFMVAPNVDPSVKGYGYVITDHDLVQIVEARHYQPDPKEFCKLNGGIYIFKRSFLELVIDSLPRNAQSGEYYLTTLAEVASRGGLKVTTIDVPFDNVRGVNTQRELWVAEQVKRSALIDHWMQQGVRFSVAQTVHLDETVTIGRGSYVGCGAQLLGNTVIGNNVTIGHFCVLRNATLHDDCTLRSHISIDSSTIAAGTVIEPFTYVRNEHTITHALHDSPLKDLTL